MQRYGRSGHYIASQGTMTDIIIRTQTHEHACIHTHMHMRKHTHTHTHNTHAYLIAFIRGNAHTCKCSKFNVNVKSYNIVTHRQILMPFSLSFHNSHNPQYILINTSNYIAHLPTYLIISIQALSLRKLQFSGRWLWSTSQLWLSC